MATGTHELRRALVAAAAVAIVLTGCGGSSSDDDPGARDNDGAKAALERRIDAVEARSKAAPTNPAPLAEIAKLRFQLATVQTSSAGAYSKAGKAELRRATDAWERYLRLDPQPVDTSVAQLMTAAYGPGSLDEPKKAVATQQVLTSNARPPDPQQFAQLAQMAYYAGETRTADLAARRAVELAPEKDRAAIRQLLKAAKAQTATQP